MVWRIGWLTPFSAPEPGQPYETLDAFRNALSELGYVEHQNYVIESRFADTDWDRLPRLAKELVDSGVDVIVTIGTPPVAAAKAATTTIPIVMVAIAFDPMALGYVTSLAKPSGNITGMVFRQPELIGKRLQLPFGLIDG